MPEQDEQNYFCRKTKVFQNVAIFLFEESLNSSRRYNIKGLRLELESALAIHFDDFQHGKKMENCSKMPKIPVSSKGVKGEGGGGGLNSNPNMTIRLIYTIYTVPNRTGQWSLIMKKLHFYLENTKIVFLENFAFELENSEFHFELKKMRNFQFLDYSQSLIYS